MGSPRTGGEKSVSLARTGEYKGWVQLGLEEKRV